MPGKRTFDRRFVLVAIALGFILPIIFIISSLLSREEPDWYQAVFGGLFTIFITLAITFFNTRIADFFGKRMPWENGWGKRLALELIATSISAAGIISIVVSILYRLTDFHEQYTFRFMIFQNVIIAIIINIILIAILEGWELFRLYKRSILETEILKRESIESQYSALINQVNPHFLFNSLNVLSFLISSDAMKAQEFISRFSWIYRYVLDVKGKSLVTLKQESEFLDAYIFLQKLRYESKLEFEIQTVSDPEAVFIPPLSLQLLVENAIKHNEISFEFPMKIEIIATEDYLEVRNRFQPRKVSEPSTGYGLNHLEARYRHFTDRKVFFGMRGEYFVARIPLLSEEK